MIDTSELPPFMPRSSRYDDEPFPEWVAGFRPWQWTAANEIVSALQRVNIVVLDAPTGSGKTLIAEMVARLLSRQRAYVCSDKGLQAQFARDFPASRVLMGRANYETLGEHSGVTAADCNSDGTWCTWCTTRTAQCPYTIAKNEALHSKCAVLNTSYLLSECNGPGRFSGRGLCVVDEADTLESSLMGHVSFELTQRTVDGLDLSVPVPVKGSHMTTIVKWLYEVLIPSASKKAMAISGESLSAIRERKRLANLLNSSRLVARMLDADSSQWVRDNDNNLKPLVLRPIVVDQLAEEHLWKHAEQWLLMSATVVSADEMMSSLGKERDAWEVVTCPMVFPVENRRTVVAPIADMSNKGKAAGAWDQAARALVAIANRHPSDRILVHGVSYGLCSRLADELHRETTRKVFTHTTASGRQLAIDRYRVHEAAVLISPSLERGLDLHGENCRVIVICKVPFLYLGDAQVNARMHRGREGSTWYTVQAIRAMVQMTGRGVRSVDDWAVSYILDSNFVRNIWSKNRHLLPAWWVEALDLNSDNRWLRGGGNG